jgi:S-adenosylmethionine synthetase
MKKHVQVHGQIWNHLAPKMGSQLAKQLECLLTVRINEGLSRPLNDGPKALIWAELEDK